MVWPILTEGLLPRQSLLLGRKGGPGCSCFPKKEHLLGWVGGGLGGGMGAGAGEARLLHPLGIEGQSPAPTGSSRLIQV